MAIGFSLYYFSEKTGEYLQKIVNASPHGIVVQTTALSTFLPATINASADVLFIEYDEGIDGLDLWIEKIKAQIGDSAIYLYINEPTTTVLLQALRLGVQECFINPIKHEEFQKALNRLLHDKPDRPLQEQTRLVTVLGCKGGAGATFMAVNLAQSLAQGLKEDVLLCDLDLKAGDTTSFLDLRPKYTILDIIDNFDRMDIHYLKDIIHSREVGFDVLPGPLRMEDSELVEVHHVEKILQYIREQRLYRWIILDIGDQLDEITLKAAEMSDTVLLVSLLTIPGLRDTKKLLEMLHILGFDEMRVKVLANCYSKQSDIAVPEAKKFLGQDIQGVVHFDHDPVIRSINEGRPLVEILPRHQISGDIRDIISILHHDNGANGHRTSLLSSLRQWLRWGSKS